MKNGRKKLFGKRTSFPKRERFGEHSAVFAEAGKTPDVRFTTWDDYAVMAMVECGLGISVLPRLILKRVPYRITVRKIETPVCRKIGVAMRNKQRLPVALRRFLDYLPYRGGPDLDNVTRT